MTILKIIPAVGWSAVFEYEDGIWIAPIVCWALAKDWEGERLVVGMYILDTAVYPVTDPQHFTRFLHYIPTKTQGQK